jgi:hypothetical protein
MAIGQMAEKTLLISSAIQILLVFIAASQQGNVSQSLPDRSVARPMVRSSKAIALDALNHKTP